MAEVTRDEHTVTFLDHLALKHLTHSDIVVGPGENPQQIKVEDMRHVGEALIVKEICARNSEGETSCLHHAFCLLREPIALAIRLESKGLGHEARIYEMEAFDICELCTPERYIDIVLSLRAAGANPTRN